METNKLPTRIKIPNSKSDNNAKFMQLLSICRIIYSQRVKCTIEEKILSYMAYYSVDGIYYAHKGSKTDCCKRLKISKDQYIKAVRKLRKLGLINSMQNSNGSTYIFYNFPAIIKQIIKQKGNFEVYIEGNIN